MITKKTFALVSMVVGMTVVACGGGDGGNGGGGNGGSGNSGTGAGNNTSTSVGSQFTCCINASHYRCPDKAAFDKCAGFDIDACMQGCGFTDFNCMDDCFAQWDNATNDPSDCVEDPSAQCGGSGGTGGGGPVGSCVGQWDGKQCDYDSDCSSNNCYNNKCYATDNGNPCDYDSDCNSNNCYSNCCYGNGAGNPCDYDSDCDSNNCYNNKCQ